MSVHSELSAELTAAIDAVPLVDHHCHGLITGPLERSEFEQLATESDWVGPPGTTVFDSQLGLVIRAECSPLLDLPRHASAEDYLARRSEIGHVEVAKRLLGSTGIATFGIDTGFVADTIYSPKGMADLSGQTTREVVRLEALAERLVAGGVSSADYVSAVTAEIERRTADALGVKSIIAYRCGLDFDPTRPSAAEVTKAADRWLSSSDTTRISDPVLLRHLLWTAVDLAVPIQLHIGYGDSDIVLHRCNPTHLTEFLHATRTSGAHIMLLHCWPYQREAAYLAQVYPHVWMDVGVAVAYSGLGSAHVIREGLEMVPFHKVLFSTDAYGLAELYCVGALLWRRGIAEVLGGWVDRDQIGYADAVRVATMIGKDNAALAYGDRL